ncbi:anthocyanidin 3-O-glucosyltransferase 5 isoform X3 [Jatropha curcas]|uniref:anthocyanidin 3-O-glucosyltransferase 5 isoform X3 n=1 Tax=Jatropha curcas TaxID=180498 RepID=UPI0018953334|nr:anthocyanidin 3-O-glucosyltransferase 5 isoform X3 [Jatropha curcas]
MEITNSKPHLVFLSSPGLGHLIPVLELGNRLVTLCNFEVTIFTVLSNTSQTETQLLQSAMTAKICEIIQLPPVDISSLIQPEAAVVTQISVMMREIRPAFRSALSALNFRPAAIIIDLFGTESLEIAKELGIPKYVYMPNNAWFLALTIYLPFLDQVVEGEFVDQKENLEIPGCRPVRPEDVVDPMLDRSNQQYFEYVRVGNEIPKADGILVNTWEALEPTTLAALRDENLLYKTIKIPVFPIGPVRRAVGKVQVGSKCELLNWLDNQPKESVVYVSFGSGGTLSFEQMQEIAYGLEMSHQRFIWVVRRPTIETGDSSFFTTGNVGDDDISRYLPDGFLTRTKNIGRVIPGWGPQVQIIGHPSTGVFLSHCGWNSILESLTNGVPIIGWPLYAEQRLNATLLEEELGVAVKPKILPSNGVVKREEIVMMIRKIMADEEEGDKIRKRVKEVKENSERALNEGGSSCNALSSFAGECKKGWKR